MEDRMRWNDGCGQSYRKFKWPLTVTLVFMVTAKAFWWCCWKGQFHNEPRLALNLETEAVINPHPFRFTMAHPDKCEDGGRDVFLVIIVHTAHDHVAERQAIRATWGNESNVPGVAIKTLFALGTTDDPDLQHNVELEDAMYGDIIQENFQDSYMNLTLKTVMTLNWFVTFCAKATYLMKTDDDTYVNVYNLVKLLRRIERRTQLVVGFVITEAPPRRDVTSKWYLSVEDYPKKRLPWYVAGGTGYVISSDMVRLLYETSLRTAPLHIEDVYIGMCLEKLGITPVQDRRFHCCDKLTYDPCTYKYLITSHGIRVDEMYVIWEGDRTLKTGCGIYHDWIVPALNYLLYP